MDDPQFPFDLTQVKFFSKNKFCLHCLHNFEAPLPPLPLTYLLLLPALPLWWHSQLPQFRVYGGSGWSFELQEL